MGKHYGIKAESIKVGVDVKPTGWRIAREAIRIEWNRWLYNLRVLVGARWR